MPARNFTLPTGVAVIPDDIADEWEAAKAAHKAAVAAIRSSEKKLRAILGNAELGMRENGKVFCRRQMSVTAGKYVKVHHRDDIKQFSGEADNGQ